MAHIKITSEIQNIKTSNGIENLTNIVYTIDRFIWTGNSSFVRIDGDSYLNEGAEDSGSMALQNALSTIQLDKDEVIKSLIPLIQTKLSGSLEYQTEDLVLKNTDWHTEDNDGNPISGSRDERVFLTWKQSSNLSVQYPALVQYIVDQNIPIVDDLHGKWMYFEEIYDTPENPHLTILQTAGAYIEQ